MATFTEPFTYSNGALDSVSSGAWVTTAAAGWSVNSNAARPGGTGAYTEGQRTDNYTSGSYFAAATVTFLSGAYQEIGIIVGGDGSTASASYYCWVGTDGTAAIVEWPGGTHLDDASSLSTAAGAHTIEARLNTSTDAIELYWDSSLVCSATDATYSGGHVGLGCYTDGPLATVDNMTGGDFASGTNADVTATIVTATVSVAAPTTSVGSTVTASIVTAVVDVPAATVSVSAKVLFRFDLDIEAQLFDDVAINWDDPDFPALEVGGSPTATIVTAAIELPAPTVALGSEITASVVTASVEAPAPGVTIPSATIGNTSIMANSAASQSDWNVEALVHSTYRYTATTGDSVIEVAAYGDGTGTAVIGVYVYAGGEPTDLVDSAVLNIGASAGWYTQAVSWPLDNGVVYVVGIDYYHDASWNIRYGDGPGGTASVADWTSGNVLPSNFTVSDSGTDAVSAYASVGGGGGVDAEVTATEVTATVNVPTPTILADITITADVVTAVVSTPVPNVTVPTLALYPASISGRKILDQNSDVFLLPTMSAWGMAQNLTDAQITTQLEAIANNNFKGVTVWIGGGRDGTGWNEYTNENGDPFWTGTPWASSLGSGWASVDHIVDECERLGLVPSLSFDGGFGAGDAGTDWEGVTNTNMYNAGVAIATRYLAAPHIIWHIMLDDATTTPASTRGTRIQNLFDGINDTEGSGTRPVRWLEAGGGDTTDGMGWFQVGFFNATINCIYSYEDESVEDFESGWAETTEPTGDCEPPYVGSGHYSPANEHQKVRERNYGVFIEGGCLINFGHEDFWSFGGEQLFSEGVDWFDVQGSTSLVQASYCWALIDLYVRDATWAPTSGFVTTGEGSGATKASQGASDNAALAYFPNSRSIQVDTTVIAGTGNVRLRWFDPTANTYTTISASEAQNPTRAISHPGNGTNDAGLSDYVLVVDALGTAHATASVVTVDVDVPNPAVSASTSTSPAVITATVDVPLPSVSAGSSVSVSAPVVTAAVTVPAPTISFGQTVTAAAVTAAVTVPAPTASGAAAATATVINATASVPAPTVSASSTATPAVVTAVVTLLAPSVSAGASVNIAAGDGTATVSVPAATVSVGQSVTANVVTAVVGVIPPTVSGSAAATPAVVTAAVTIPAATASGSAAATPPVTTATVDVPLPSVSAGSSVSVTAPVVTAAATVLSPSVTASSTAIAAVVSSTVTVPAATVTASSGAALTPAVVTAACSVPAPTVSAGSTVTANVVTAAVSVDAPGVAAGSNATVTAATVTTAVDVPAPAFTSSVVVTASVVTATVTVPTATPSAPVSATPPVVTATVGVPVPGVTAGSGVTVTLAVVTATVGVAAATVTTGTGVSVSPPVVTATVDVPSATVEIGQTVSPATVTVRCLVSPPSLTIGLPLAAIVVTAAGGSITVSAN